MKKIVKKTIRVSLVFVIVGLFGGIFVPSCSSFTSTTHITLDSLKVSNLDYIKENSFINEYD